VIAWAGAWLALAAGCAGPGAETADLSRTPTAGEPAQKAAPASPVPVSSEPALVPSGPGARTYASAAAPENRVARPDPLRAKILEDAVALARRSGLPAPEGDPRLDQAMDDLARHLRGDDLPALEVVDFLLAHYGIVEPSPHLLLARATAGADREIRDHTLSEIAEVYKANPIARVGIGIDRVGELMYVVVGLQERHVELSSVPRHLPRGGGSAIAGKLVGRYRDPRVVITAPDGKVSEQEPTERAGGFRGQVRCSADGRYQVEVTAVDAAGTAVLANFPVFCGIQPPAVAPRGAGVKQSGISVGAAEKQLLALVNRDRATAGLRPVTPDARLTEIARAHSRDMADHDFVGHVSPRTGTALDRVRRGGLQPELVLENVGRAYSAEEAEAGFMSSPGHRGNLVDPRAARAGLGIVFGKPVTGTIPMFVTQLFTN
jgi:uncharacterized protein YkwD